MAVNNAMESGDVALNPSFQAMEEDVDHLETSTTAVKATSEVSGSQRILAQMNSEAYRKFLRKAIDDVKLQKVIDLLSEIPVHEAARRKMAEGLLSGTLKPGGVKLKLTANKMSYINKILEDKLESCISIKDMDPLHVIFVCADTETEMSEMVNFLETLFSEFSTGQTSDHINRFTRYAVVANGADVGSCLTAYFGEMGYDGLSATRAVLSMIVVLGHGEQDGLTLQNGNSMALDDIINQTHQLYYDTVTASGGFPAVCELVFTQCYGHSYDQSQTSKLSGKPFSEYFQVGNPSLPPRCANPTTQRSKESCHRFGVVHFTEPGTECTNIFDDIDKRWENFEANQYAMQISGFIAKLVEHRPEASLMDAKVSIISVELGSESFAEEQSSIY